MAMYNGIEVSEEYGGDMRMIDDPDNPTIEGIWDSERLLEIHNDETGECLPISCFTRAEALREFSEYLDEYCQRF